MEKASHVRNGNGGINLPIGFRFHPTDEELLVHYLKRKVCSLPLPASVIPDDQLDVFHTNPWDLPGDMREKRFFFSKRKANQKRYSSVCIGSGYWKTIGKEKQILATESKRVIGMKKSLVFNQGNWPHGPRTPWLMHEYRLVGCRTTPYSNERLLVGKQDWVVCCIALKKTKAKKHGVRTQYSISNKSGNTEIIMPSFMDFMMEDSTDTVPPQPFSPCSASGITEVSCDESNQEANSICCDSFTKKPVKFHGP